MGMWRDGRWISSSVGPDGMSCLMGVHLLGTGGWFSLVFEVFVSFNNPRSIFLSLSCDGCNPHWLGASKQPERIPEQLSHRLTVVRPQLGKRKHHGSDGRQVVRKDVHHIRL